MVSEEERVLNELKQVKQSFKDNLESENISTENVEFRNMPELLKGMEKKLPNQTKNINPTTSEQIVTADSGYKLTQVNVKAVKPSDYYKPEQSVSVNPKTTAQTITPTGNSVYNRVDVGAVTSEIDSNIIPTNIRKGKTILGVTGNLEADKPDQQKTVNPTTSQQSVVADSGYELAKVTVNAVTSAIDNNIKSSNIKKGVSILGVTGTLEESTTTTINLQEKTINPTTSRQSVTADGGYDGLSKVNVEAVIPSDYYKPEEIANVTPTTNAQVITPTSNSVFNKVNVSAVTSAIDENIKAENIKKDVTILGVTGTMQATSGSPKFAELVDGSITEVNAQDLSDITTIRDSVFANLEITSVEIPSNIIVIDDSAFVNNEISSLVLNNGVTTIGASAFANNPITQLLIPNSVTTIGASAFAGTQITELDMSNQPNPPSVTSTSFPETLTTIHVAYRNYDTYLSAWSDYADKIVRLPAIPSTIIVTVDNYLGELVSGASVTITGNEQTFTGTTNENGVFVQGDLQPATYTITVANIDGFKTPSASEVVITEDTQNTITVTYLELPAFIPVTYGIKIDLTNSDPETSVTYTDDAVDFNKSYMDFGNDTFEYGSWADKFPFNQIKPCILKDGVVTTYLNPNNYAEDVDGNAIDITKTCDGDVMIEIPKIYYYLHNDENYQYIQISNHKVDDNYCCLAHTYKGAEKDKVYIGAYHIRYDGTSSRSVSGVYATGGTSLDTWRTRIHDKGFGYEPFYWNLLVLLQCLYVIQFKNLDSQTVLGFGWVSDNKNTPTTGGLNTKGLYYGTSSNGQMKFMGIEDWYGVKNMLIDGAYIKSRKLTVADVTNPDTSFNGTGEGYIEVATGLPTGSGWVREILGENHTGFCPKKFASTSSGYYSDNANANNDCVAGFGGSSLAGVNAGACGVSFVSSSSSGVAARSSRLAYCG